MSNKNFLKELVTARGVPGYEENVAKIVHKHFKQFFGNAEIDDFYNVTATMGKGKPVIYCSAHIDEIGLMVTSVEDDGFLGFCSVGGVDPRVLMAQEVTVHTDSGELFGIIGAKPPHVLSPDDMKKAPKMSDLFIDIGMSPERAKNEVNVGDMITFNAPPIDLLNKRIASKTLDDRMGVIVLLEAAKYIQDKDFNATVVFCASTQEEIGAKGARVSSFRADPDMAVAVDVSHGKTPDAKDEDTQPLENVSLALSPFCDRNMFEIFKQAAETVGVEYSVNISGARTGTDGDAVQQVGVGIPISVLGVPLKYMHTTVETLSYTTVKNAGKLLGQFILEVGGAS